MTKSQRCCELTGPHTRQYKCVNHFASLGAGLLINWQFFQLLRRVPGWAAATREGDALLAGWHGAVGLRLTEGLPPKRLRPWHVAVFRFAPSSRCQDIWFSFGEIFVVIFPSGFNYCPWNINGCPAGLMDFICVPSYLGSVAGKSEPCFAANFMEQPQPEVWRMGRFQRMKRYQIWETGILICKEDYFCYLNNLTSIEKTIHCIPKWIP